jgi:hypothetical protein
VKHIHRRRSLRELGLVAAVAVGCAASAVPEVKIAPSRPAPAITRAPEVELFYKGEQPWARRGTEEWSLGDVQKGEMVFSPDGKRFAYVRQRTTASAGRTTALPAHVLIRNLAGDPVNDFSVFRPGEPTSLSWIDNRHLGYLAPPEPGRKTSPTFVLHDADTGEVLAARSGSQFTWDPAHHHVAFVVGKPGQQALVVDGKNVWPRRGVTSIHGEPVWSNDGHGIAFVDAASVGPKLVVLVEYADPQGDLSWPVPAQALAPGLRVYWASDSKVIIGEDKLKPRFAAGWERLQ